MRTINLTQLLVYLMFAKHHCVNSDIEMPKLDLLIEELMKWDITKDVNITINEEE